MTLHFSNKELDLIESRVDRSINTLTENGTMIGDQHNLSVIKKLIEENRELREELLGKKHL